MSMAMKKTWGIFVNYGGFGPQRNFETDIDYNYNTEVISDEKDKNNKQEINNKNKKTKNNKINNQIK